MHIKTYSNVFFAGEQRHTGAVLKRCYYFYIIIISAVRCKWRARRKGEKATMAAVGIGPVIGPRGSTGGHVEPPGVAAPGAQHGRLFFGRRRRSVSHRAGGVEGVEDGAVSEYGGSICFFF